jgi:nucleotide-binding universal stress UspA family protein
MLQKILVPLDGSPHAERVLSHIQRLKTPQTKTIVLLRVLKPYENVFVPASSPNIEMTRLRQEAEEYLAGVKGELRQMGLQSHTHILEGDVATAICDVADVQDVDLIAMTTHGRSGVSRWAYGSIADRVIRTATQPIFLVRGATESPTEGRIQRILLPLDGSDLAEQAFPVALALGKSNAAEVVLLRAIQPLTDRELALVFASWGSREEIYQQQDAAARTYLDDLVDELRSSGLESSTVIEEGYPAEVILDAADSQGIDLIVMSTHGRSGLGRWVYGSVADKVMRRAAQPVLLVRARLETDASP